MASKRQTILTPLREEREKRGWTLEFLHACLCGLIDDMQKTPISIRQIESWERGEHLPHPYWRQRLCMAYKKNAEELGLVRHGASSEREAPPTNILTSQKKYLQHLAELYGTIKLPIGPAQGFSLQAVFQPLRLCQTPPAQDGESMEQWYSMLDRQPFDEQEQIQEQSLSPGEAPLIVENGDEALKKSPSKRIVILGGPGTGKSTLLKYFVGKRAQEAMQNPQAPLPIFIALPEFGRSGKTVKSYLQDMLQDLFLNDTFLEVLWQKIQQGEAFLCFDSLDEVTTGQADIVRKINTLLTLVHPATTCVISSRFTDFKRGQFLASQMLEWELLPLDHGLCQMLAERLLPELQQRMPQALVREPKTFLKTLEMHPRIAAWGKNPLLFSLAAILYVRRGQLPESRKELYLQIIDAIIELREPVLEWRVTLREIFAALAYKLLTAHRGRSFSVADLITLLRSIRQEQGESWQIEEIARRLRNVGLLETIGPDNFSFLHQTFQEYLAGYYVSLLPFQRAEREIDHLIEHIDDPFYRQIIIELAHIVNQQNPALEDYLYQSTIQQFKRAKMGLLEAQHSGRLTSSTAISAGCNAVLQVLVDVWGMRLCATLEAGSPNNKEDGEVASSIAWVFERNPRTFAVPALIASLAIYQKRARFLGALGEIGNKEAQDALYLFTMQQLANPTDLPLFRYLTNALGQARVEQAIPLLQMIRDNPQFDLETRIEAHHALHLMGQESTFDEQSYYQIERILQALHIEDEQHRLSDWKRIVTMAHWLETNYTHTPALQPHYQTILQALTALLSHSVDSARQAAVSALGKLGDHSTFLFLLQSLQERGEPDYAVASFMLRALEQLAVRQQINITQTQFLESIERIKQHYPALEDEIARTQMRIQVRIESESIKD